MDGFGVAPQGSGICSSSVLHGMVFKKEAEGDVTSVKDAKIAVYSCPFDGMITETKVPHQGSGAALEGAWVLFWAVCSSPVTTVWSLETTDHVWF